MKSKDSDRNGGVASKLRSTAAVKAVTNRASKFAVRSAIPTSVKGFPFTAPNIPVGQDPVAKDADLGVNFDTDWAREAKSQVFRAAVQDTLLLPGLKAITAPKVRGTDRFEHLEAPVLFAANHHSHFDIGVVIASLPRRFRSKTIVAASSDYFFDKRFKAAMSALLINAVPIERNKISRQSMDQIRDLMQEGWNLVIFPEGGRSPDGLGHEFKAGAPFLAQRVGCPIVPVHISGTDQVLPKGASVPKRHNCTVTFGSPIHIGADDDPREVASAIESAVDSLAQEARSDWWTARKLAASGATESLRGDQNASSWRRNWAKTATDDKPRAERPKRSWP